MPIFRKPEKKNLRKLVHRAPICATFKKPTWYLNTLYMAKDQNLEQWYSSVNKAQANSYYIHAIAHLSHLSIADQEMYARARVICRQSRGNDINYRTCTISDRSVI